jgi:hypothetical protein
MIDNLTKKWLIESIDSCPNIECTYAIIETIEFLFMIDRDAETFDKLMIQINNKQKILK